MNVQTIRRRVTAAGSFFFTPKTMSHWKSQVHEGVFSDGTTHHFVTSEEMAPGVRTYKVRTWREDQPAIVASVGRVRHPTLELAQEEAARLQRGG